MIKLIATDLDGTLLLEDHVTIPEKNIEMLKWAQEKGIHIVLASGRTFGLMRDTAEKLGGVDYIVTSNGAAVYDGNGDQVLEPAELSRGQMDAVLQVVKQYPVVYEIYSSGTIYMEERLLPYFKEMFSPESFMEYILNRCSLVESLPEAMAGKTAEKFNIAYVPEACREEILQELGKIEGVAMCSSFSGNIEVNSIHANKGNAIENICRSLGIKPEEVMAFGDSGNDIEMLQYAGWSFAMENAIDPVVEAARHMTLSNEKGGVGAAIEKYVKEKAARSPHKNKMEAVQ